MATAGKPDLRTQRLLVKGQLLSTRLQEAHKAVNQLETELLQVVLEWLDGDLMNKPSTR